MGLTGARGKPRIPASGHRRLPASQDAWHPSSARPDCAPSAKESCAMATSSSTSHSISATELARTLGSARHPLVIDVRREAAFATSPHLICGSLHRPPETVARWSRDLPVERPIIVTCVHGHEVGQPASTHAILPAASRVGSKPAIRTCARRRSTTALARRLGSRGRGRRSTASPVHG